MAAPRCEKHVKAPARKGGAPQKVPGGLTRVLYVRANKSLMVKLERVRGARSRTYRVNVSIADVVRALLEEAIVREDVMQDDG